MGPAINAEYRRGQLAGFYIDRKAVVTASLDNMTRPELEAKLKEIRDHNVINGEAIGVEIKEIEEEKQDLVKRKCFACSREKAMGKFERYCSDSCRTRATRYYQAPNSISW